MDSTVNPSPPPIVSGQYRSLGNTEVLRPTPNGVDYETVTPSPDLEMNAIKALYPLLFHLEKELRDVELVRDTRTLSSDEAKKLKDTANLLDKKIFTIHELLELLR